MNQTMTARAASVPISGDELEYATFYVCDILLGLDIRQIEEINRQLTMTSVPHAPHFVRGVVNLRGEVATVVDLRAILGLPAAEITDQSRNVVVNARGERIGLLVDRIGDVVRTSASDIEPPPANVSGVDGRFFRGVCKLEKELLVILDVEEALAGSPPPQERSDN